ncbi:hypothetical protein QVD99_000523 [Batrachochytrium dendrobatidis]|nr:hypothetical protein QVD99_000523 [Batrachochytrium dendrobatidis]
MTLTKAFVHLTESLLVIKVIAGDTLSGPICDAFIDAIWKGKMQLKVTGNDATGNDGADAIRYGLGFGQIKMELYLPLKFKISSASRDSASTAYHYQHSDQVCFPDHMCGPDIIYKCANTKTVYIVQVKFVKKMSKQEAANAYNTTDPERFYCKRNGGGVLKGFEEKRTYLLSTLSELHESGYSLQQTLVIHTAEKNPVDAQGMEIINS